MKLQFEKKNIYILAFCKGRKYMKGMILNFQPLHRESTVTFKVMSSCPLGHSTAPSLLPAGYAGESAGESQGLLFEVLTSQCVQ